MKSITACTYDCPDACSLILEQSDDGSMRLTGNPDSPFTRGVICAKTRSHIRRLRSPNRIAKPLLRTRTGWQEIGWDAALDLCAWNIQRLRTEPASILHVHSDGAKGVLKEAVNLFFSSLGSSRIRGSLCDAAGFLAGIEDFGSRDNNDAEDLAQAAAIVNWGKDLSRSSIHTAAIVHRARKNGARVLTISPGGDGNDSFSDERIRIRPGTDRFLAAAVIQRLLAESRIAPEVITHTRQPESFFDLIRKLPTGDLLAASEVGTEDVKRLFRMYTDHRPAATLIGAGLQRYRFGGENVRFIDALALLSGNVGCSGGGVYFHLHSFRNLNLDWTKGPGFKGRRAFHIPTISRDILSAQHPPVRMIWVNGSNFVNQAPNACANVRAMEGVEFKVVVDAFLNDTSQRADLVLPCTLMFEQEDIIGSFLHEYVQYVSAVVDPPEAVRTDLWIVTEIGKRLDPPVVMPSPEACLQAALESPYLETTLDELRRSRYVRAKRPRIAYEGLVFAHSDGQYRFPSALHDEPPRPAGYPLRLLTLVRRTAIHSQILPEDQTSAPAAWVAPDSPALRGIDGSRPVALVSPLGRLPVSLRLMAGLHPETIVYRRGDWMNCGGGINQLIASELTDLGGGAAFYDQYVRLENT